MTGVWSDALAAAKKILGPDGKLPTPRVDPASVKPPIDKALAAFDTSLGDLEKKLLDVENSLSVAKNTFKQYGDMVDGKSFGLNEGDPKQKKRITDATDIILKALQKMEGACDEGLGTMAKLNRILTDLRRLKDIKV